MSESESGAALIKLSRNTWLGMTIISLMPVLTVTTHGWVLHEKLENAVARVQHDIKTAEERIQTRQNELELQIEKNRANAAQMFLEILNRLEGHKQ